MAYAVNKAIILGNLGGDPDVRQTQSGLSVASLNVATTHGVKQNDGTWQDVTEWHRITVWGNQADLCKRFLSKGSKVYIEGRLQTRKWQDKTGNDRYTTEIVARDIVFLDPKQSGGQGSNQGFQNQASQPQSSPQASQQGGSPASSTDNGEDFPF